MHTFALFQTIYVLEVTCNSVQVTVCLPRSSMQASLPALTSLQIQRRKTQHTTQPIGAYTKTLLELVQGNVGGTLWQTVWQIHDTAGPALTTLAEKVLTMDGSKVGSICGKIVVESCMSQKELNASKMGFERLFDLAMRHEGKHKGKLWCQQFKGSMIAVLHGEKPEGAPDNYTAYMQSFQKLVQDAFVSVFGAGV